MNAIGLPSRILVLCAAVSVCAASTADAQHLRYKTKSEMNLESLGFIGSLLDSEFVEEASISGNIKRVDRKDSSTITNLDTEEIINLNHKKKEYSVVTFEELMQAFKDATAYGQMQAADGSGGSGSGDDVPEYKVDFDLRVEDTGKSKKIDGVKAYQKVLIIETLFEPADEALLFAARLGQSRQIDLAAHVGLRSP